MKFSWFLAILVCAGCVKKPDPAPQTVVNRPAASAANPHQPFGHHGFEYTRGAILPSHVERQTLDETTARFYDQWKESYVRQGCGPDLYRVVTETSPRELGGSEALGYGMIIVALLAGHDPDAQRLFDGMMRFASAHQSALTDGLMAWHQDGTCRDTNGGHSFSGGDLDRAYALLLADKQWGSCGGPNYRQQARKVIAAITRGELHHEGRYVLLGDWVDASHPLLYNATRSADFAPGHFRSYQTFMGQSWWLGVIDNGYWLLETLQILHSPESGLLPDYVQDADSEEPRPAEPGFQNDESAHRYGLIASRVPLRLGSDFLVSGDNRARRVLERLNAFVRSQAHEDPAELARGFALDGTPTPGTDSLAFSAPLGISAMVDAKNQKWLDALWRHVAQAAGHGFRDDTARLMSMLLMSNNWWPPEYGSDPCLQGRGSETR